MYCVLCCTGGTLEYCAYNAEVYSVGESWLVDECTQCTCVDGAQVLCSVTVCEVSTSAECSSSPVDQLCCHVCHSQSTCRPRRRFTFCSKLNVKFAFETHTYTRLSELAFLAALFAAIKPDLTDSSLLKHVHTHTRLTAPFPGLPG